MKLSQLIPAFMASAFIFTGCMQNLETDDLLSLSEQEIVTSSLEKETNLNSGLLSGFDKGFGLPSDLLFEIHPEHQEFVKRTLQAVEPASCDDNTAFNNWLDNEISDWNREIIDYVLATAMLELPRYDALFFESSSSNQYFGINGEYTKSLTKAFRDLKRFWNIESEDIVMVAMHGSMLADRDKLFRTYRAIGLNPAVANFFADFVRMVINTYPQLRGGNHPVFTFNSYASAEFIYPSLGTIPPKILIGDGMMDAFAALGFGDVAPQAILAHEFGHQIQFELGIFDNSGTSASSRRMELMADALASYYLSHARGATMNWKRAQQFFQVFFNIGDCAFDRHDHHGTPVQRMAAAEWAYELAKKAKVQGHILTAQEFVLLFDEQLPLIVLN